MKAIRNWLNGEEQPKIDWEAMGYGGHPVGSKEEFDALKRDGRLILAEETLAGEINRYSPPVARTILGGFVAKIHRQIQTAVAEADTLEAQINRDTETLRQYRVSIAAMEASLATIGTDPALTAEEIGLVEEPRPVELAGIDEELSND